MAHFNLLLTLFLFLKKFKNEKHKHNENEWLAHLILFPILFLFLKIKNEKHNENVNEWLVLPTILSSYNPTILSSCNPPLSHPRYPMHITIILFDVVFDFAHALGHGGHVVVTVFK